MIKWTRIVAIVQSCFFSSLALSNATNGSISPTTYFLQAFTRADPKSAKIQSRNKSFAPLESVGIKVARKNICDIDPWSILHSCTILITAGGKEK